VSAAEALRAAHEAGVTMMLDGESLMLEAKVEPPQAVLNALARHKSAILALLRPGQDGWFAEDWRAYFDKRSGVFASHNGQSRAEAEASAFECCVIDWLNQHPTPSTPGHCAWCGKAESPGAVVLPFGTEPGTHAWLHADCWPVWYQARRAEAIAALRAMDIQA
jgi:hypothetical protein